MEHINRYLASSPHIILPMGRILNPGHKWAQTLIGVSDEYIVGKPDGRRVPKREKKITRSKEEI